MDALTAGRWQMEVSLAFHMMFAAAGMAMPAMLLIAESRWLRSNDLTALALARTWSRALAVLFAVGAVSGTALSFELGLLWPKFMAFAGPIVGMMFAFEGYAFFTEAIFLGLYLYGWGKMSPRAHWLAAWPVAISGALSGALVLGANSWMQSPAGFAVGADGLPASIDPIAALFNPSWALMAVHAVAEQPKPLAATLAKAWKGEVDEIFDGCVVVRTGSVEFFLWSVSAWQSEYKAIEAMAPEQKIGRAHV